MFDPMFSDQQATLTRLVNQAISGRKPELERMHWLRFIFNEISADIDGDAFWSRHENAVYQNLRDQYRNKSQPLWFRLIIANWLLGLKDPGPKTLDLLEACAPNEYVARKARRRRMILYPEQ